ncbi:MAG: MbtH family protein [Rhodopirellula sp.]|nr:MbtH family protein [Rhodopirellula sp.]
MSEEYPDWQDGRLKVVKNSDNVCSIWPADRSNALGWEDVGESGTREQCLAFIKRHCDGNCRLRDPVASQSHVAG